MKKVIVYIDDAAHALAQIAQWLPVEAAAGDGARHWVVVACPPRMTQRISKWVSHSARENWRGKWLHKTMGEVGPALRRPGDELTPILAKGSLLDLTQQLRTEHGAAKVIDARRPKIGVNMEPVAPEVKPASQSGWALPGAAISMGGLLVLASELSE